MKRLNLLFLLVGGALSAAHANTNNALYPPTMQKMYPTQQGQIWPTPMMQNRWPANMYKMPQMQQTPRMMQTMPMFPAQQMAAPRYTYPYAMPYRPVQPYSAPAYSTPPPVLRFPANQTFQQARPVYGANTPYAAPQVMQQTPYAQQAYPPTMNTPTQAQAKFPMQKRPPFKKKVKKKKKPWGDTRYIWPDFYTDATGDMWDNMMNAPYDMGRMPGGWRAPSLSTPDPVTVGDAVTNQFPPVIDEIPNFMPFMK